MSYFVTPLSLFPLETKGWLLVSLKTSPVVTMIQMVPEHTNHYGTLFGGKALRIKLVDASQ